VYVKEPWQGGSKHLLLKQIKTNSNGLVCHALREYFYINPDTFDFYELMRNEQ